MLIPLGVDVTTGQTRPIVNGEDLVTPSGLGMLAVFSRTAVDLVTAGVTPLFTVPAGRKFMLVAVHLRCTSGGGSMSDPAVGVGTNVAADNIVASGVLVGFELTDHVWQLQPTNVFVIADAGQQIKFEVDTPAGATILDASADLIGYLI